MLGLRVAARGRSAATGWIQEKGGSGGTARGAGEGRIGVDAGQFAVLQPKRFCKLWQRGGRATEEWEGAEPAGTHETNKRRATAWQ